MISRDENPTSAAQDADSAAPSPRDSAEKILRKSSYQAIRSLKCGFQDGVLTLSGQLPSYYLKQVVLSAVRDIEGVERIENLIEVVM